MAKSSGTFNKREQEKKRAQKRKDKEQRKEDKKASKTSKSFEEMLAYVDENGNLSSTPPDETKRKKIDESEIDLTSRNKGGAEEVTLRTGIVRYFDDSKGFGFIKDKNSSEEFFFHFSSADFPIGQNDQVTFDTEMGAKGLNAVRISKVS